MPPWAIFVLLGGAGVLVAVLAGLALGRAGANLRTARRLAGAPEVRVGTLLDARRLPERPVRVAGRVRCRDPLHVDGDERLVAYHRDVEVRLTGGRWRSVERLRESRSFELWDHDGSLAIDPSSAFEPLLTIPSIWRGDPADLDEPHASAVRRLEERHGARAAEARATTRTLNVTDRLLVLAQASRSEGGGGVALQPPRGGYLITNLALDDTMRLLGGHHRRVAAISVIGLAAGVLLTAVGIIGAAVAAFLGL